MRRTPQQLREVAALVSLMREPGGMSWNEIAVEASTRGEASSLLRDGPGDPQLFDDGSETRVDNSAALAEVEAWTKGDYEFVTVLDDHYPSSLREIHQLPPILWYRGKLEPLDFGVSVVGSRKASDRALNLAANIARGLVDREIPVLSGLAAGIDTAALTAAIGENGRPVGVIGTGILRTYPAQNRELHAQVGASGVVVSQFWPDASPSRSSFPMRNATMSGLGRATIVVEAGETSGARIQARVAVEHGRPVILTDLVVKGTNWGSAMVGKPGVHIASSTADVMQIVEQIRSERSSFRSWAKSLVTVE